MFQEIQLSNIRPNPENPRKNFEGTKFDELTASIRQYGVIEPVLVRPAGLKDCTACEFKKSVGNKAKGIKIPGAGKGKCIRPEGLCQTGPDVEFELIAGERRWRASCLIANENGGPDKHLIPAIIKDVDDDTAFDIMTIENLQRKDLNELEEARGFESYVRRRGDDSVNDLAERCGLSARYIRRRMAVLSLPEEVLEMWSAGKVRYGHLEQFLRVKDSNKLLAEMVESATDYHWSVSRIKYRIDHESLSISDAIFDTEAAGCGGCHKNTDTQKTLFGMDSENAKCLDPSCFKHHVNNHLLQNWSEIGKKYKTSGFRFGDSVGYEERNVLYKKPKKTCIGCETFVSLVTDKGGIFYEHVCIGPATCFRKTYSSSSSTDNKNKDESGPRVAWHGTFFREQFYQEVLPLKFNMMAAHSDSILRLALFSFVKNTSRAVNLWFADRHNFPISDHEWFSIDTKDLMEIIKNIPADDLLEELQAVVVFAMTQPEFGVISRHLVSSLAGINLSEEWRISEEYLKKKTRQELIDLGQMEVNGVQPVFVRAEAIEFLKSTIGQNDGRFDKCKKPDLIRVFMESGVDLSGLVPDEVLRADEYNPSGFIQ